MLNEKAKLIYDYIVDRISNDISPTVREICSDLKIKSTSTVHRYINELCQEGLIVKSNNHNRSIQLPNATAARVPLVGNVAAGRPITAVEYIEGYIPVNLDGDSANEVFALRIQGDSMINAGILNEDIVIVKKASTASNGEIVVALIDDEATAKRFYKEDGHIRLQPENDDYEPIIVDDVLILGKVIASMRYY